MLIQEIVYEMETIVEELSRLRMSRGQQMRVVRIQYNVGVVSGYFIHDGNDREACHRSLVEIRTLASIGHEEGETRKVRRRFADLLRKVGVLESWINNEIQNSGIVERIKSLVKVFLSWVL